MCGIFFCASHKIVDVNKFGPLFTQLDKRGPDSRALSQANITTTPQNVLLIFYSTVLSLRGTGVITAQPLVDDTTSSQLCWNGEAWSIGEDAISGNDAQAVFWLLLAAASQNNSRNQAVSDCVISAINSIAGPFAFVFYDAIHGRVYFGRDSLGRRSLLTKTDVEGMHLSSVGDGTSGWMEVPASGVFAMEFTPRDDPGIKENLVDSEVAMLKALDEYCLYWPYSQYGKYPSFNHSIPNMISPVLSLGSESVVVLEKQLRLSLQIRSESIPHHRTITVASNKITASPHDYPTDIKQQMSILNDQKFSSIIKTDGLSENPRLAVLFSGGLDCTVLARLLHDILPAGEEVDLLNVAFHNPRVHGHVITDPSLVFDTCPDRITARASIEEVNAVCPGRQWRLVEINIAYDEMLLHRENVVSLMHPHDTEMDLSITLALYFAARGVGITKSENDSGFKAYQTPARVLFSGLGADELFGGYQRHATAYGSQGFKGLIEELELDITRLGQRNLGRDDRVISHWGKEARYPFLDENLVRWAVTAPVWEKCGFGQDVLDNSGNECSDPVLAIEPGKKVLRLLAIKLEMKNVAREKKRAIQFGARTAKMLVGKSKGTQRIS